jgi:hypothetical protein
MQARRAASKVEVADQPPADARVEAKVAPAPVGPSPAPDREAVAELVLPKVVLSELSPDDMEWFEQLEAFIRTAPAGLAKKLATLLAENEVLKARLARIKKEVEG